MLPEAIFHYRSRTGGAFRSHDPATKFMCIAEDTRNYCPRHGKVVVVKRSIEARFDFQNMKLT